MKILELAEATAPLSEYVRGVSKEPVVLTSSGRPVAVLLAIENADWETVSLSTNSQFLALIERSRARQKREGGIPSKEMRKRLGLHSPDVGE